MEIEKDNKSTRLHICLIILAYFLLFCVKFTDIYFNRQADSFLGYGVFPAITGVLITLIFAKLTKINLKRACYKSFGFIFELLYGFAFSLLTLAITYLGELVYFQIKGYDNLNITIEAPESANFTILNVSPNRVIYFYIAFLLVNVIYKETFRALFLQVFSKKFTKKTTNIIQGVTYALLSIPHVVLTISNGKTFGESLIPFLLIVTLYIIYHFISGVKWGYLYKINGSVWMNIADHFINNLVLTTVFFSQDRLPAKWLVAKVLVVQILSCAVYLPFCYRREKMNDEMKEDYQTTIEVLRNGQIDRDSIDPSNNLNDYLNAINEHQQTRKFGTAIENETVDIVEKPSELIDVFFQELQDEVLRTDIELFEDLDDIPIKDDTATDNERPTELEEAANISGNARGISRLVKGYFNTQFDKHTFSDERNRVNTNQPASDKKNSNQ